MNPLKSMGSWRALEGAIEITVPLIVLGSTWTIARGVLASPSVGRGFSNLELLVVLGACVAITAWAASRQMYLLRRRNPWGMVLLSWLYMGGLLALLPTWVKGGFMSTCEEALAGTLTVAIDLSTTQLLGKAEQGEVICRLGGVTDNEYLPGALLRPSWNGVVPPLMWGVFAFIAAISSLGFRDRRIRTSRIGMKLFDLLRFAPSIGSKSGAGKVKIKDARVQACTNATLWGELCGQMYSADKRFWPGEFCVRCNQPFRKAERILTFKVVSLWSGDVDVLNGVERTDTVSWDRDEPMVPDARISGMERWVTLGTVELPDVISISQALSLIHEVLPKWAAADADRIKPAADLAVRRASKVSCWFWFGSLAHRLTYARPTNRAILGVGPMRLRDLITEGGEELWLQLDIGLLPLELRVGFRKSFADETRAPEYQNSKVDLWIPVTASNLPKKQAGVWVPRIEGEALRTWLATERLRDDAKGVSIPLPYRRYVSGLETPPEERTPKPGSLDFVRYPLGRNGLEPADERSVGDSIAEWHWLEWEQIQLLRQQSLVLVDAKQGSR